MNLEVEISAVNPAALADEIGRLDTLKKQIEEKLESAKAVFKALGVEKLEGNSYRLEHALSERSSLDTSALKKEMGEDWYKAHCKTMLVSTVRVKHIEPMDI